MLLLFRKASLLYKTSKIVFLKFIFTIYDMGIPGVTRGYRGLQGVTRGYKRVKRGDKGLQGVTKDYRNFFFELECSQILFLGLFCIKIKVEEISNF